MKSLVRRTAVAAVAVFILCLTALPAQADPPSQPAKVDIYRIRQHNCEPTPVGYVYVAVNSPAF